MSKVEIKNCKIDSAIIGFEGHGILSSMVSMDMGGSHQGFGGWSLGGKYMSIWVEKILKVVGVESWDELKGQAVRIKREEGWNGKIIAIGNFVEDIWFQPWEE